MGFVAIALITWTIGLLIATAREAARRLFDRHIQA